MNKVKSNNDFVRREQAAIKGNMGEKPAIPADMKRFDAKMSNDAEAANRAVSALTKGLDKAFPVNNSQE